MSIQRYDRIVQGWDAFADAAGRREPVTLRVNRARIGTEALRSSLESRGFRLEPIPGLEGFLRILDAPYAPSRTIEHWLGFFYLQQAVTAGVAPLAMEARPGERVLDLCAAPGGKTSHLAELLGGCGVVVAGDRNEGRIRGLLGNLYRLGHAGVLVVAADGRAFPSGALFDRVLVDAPCSGEGNLRRRGGALPEKAESFRSHIAGVQRRLLQRAVELTRPGGTILYVTCTFAPEENEAVVARALARLPVTIEPIELDLPHEPGLTRYGSRVFPSDLAQAWRLYPQHLDSGGLFLARLRREEGRLPAGLGDPSFGLGWTPVPPIFPGSKQETDAVIAVEEGWPAALGTALERLKEQMALPRDALDQVRWIVRGDSVWMHACDEWPVPSWHAEGAGAVAPWRVVSLGLRAFRFESGGRLRPTNDLLRRLGGLLGDRVVALDRSAGLRLLERGELALEARWDGYVAIALEGHVVGRGWLRSGRLRSEVPRAQARLLADALRVGDAAPADA